jgi:hypothetical protein
MDDRKTTFKVKFEHEGTQKERVSDLATVPEVLEQLEQYFPSGKVFAIYEAEEVVITAAYLNSEVGKQLFNEGDIGKSLYRFKEENIYNK